jgi:hypothetical protein
MLTTSPCEKFSFTSHCERVQTTGTDASDGASAFLAHCGGKAPRIYSRWRQSIFVVALTELAVLVATKAKQCPYE